MKLLLDTHVLLWLLAQPQLLPARVAKAIASPRNTLFVSIVSMWELTIKSAKGTLTLPADNIDLVAVAIRQRGIDLLSLEIEDLAELAALPLLHRDPFDRALVAQARRHGATLVTVDQVLRGYSVEVLWS